MILFCPEYQKTIFSGLISEINTLNKIFNFLTKTMKNFDFWTFLKLRFFSLKTILFYPEYQETVFSDLICPKKPVIKKIRFFHKNHGLTPFKNFDFFDFTFLVYKSFFPLKNIKRRSFLV